MKSLFLIEVVTEVEVTLNHKPDYLKYEEDGISEVGSTVDDIFNKILSDYISKSFFLDSKNITKEELYRNICNNYKNIKRCYTPLQICQTEKEVSDYIRRNKSNKVLIIKEMRTNSHLLSYFGKLANERTKSKSTNIDKLYNSKRFIEYIFNSIDSYDKYLVMRILFEANSYFNYLYYIPLYKDNYYLVNNLIISKSTEDVITRDYYDNLKDYYTNKGTTYFKDLVESKLTSQEKRCLDKIIKLLKDKKIIDLKFLNRDLEVSLEDYNLMTWFSTY